MTSRAVDFLIIGAGIIGVNLAIRAKMRHPDCKLFCWKKSITAVFMQADVIAVCYMPVFTILRTV